MFSEKQKPMSTSPATPQGSDEIAQLFGDLGMSVRSDLTTGDLIGEGPGFRVAVADLSPVNAGSAVRVSIAGLDEGPRFHGMSFGPGHLSLRQLETLVNGAAQGEEIVPNPKELRDRLASTLKELERFITDKKPGDLKAILETARSYEELDDLNAE